MMWSVRPLNDSVGDLGAGLFGLLACPLEHFLEFFLVLARVGDEHAGRGQVGIVATDHGDRQGALRELEQLLDAQADPLLERLGGVFEPLRQLVAKFLEAGIVPELAVLAATERLAKRFDIVES